ncbi:MAG: hypothetical protein DRP54_02640 [Spirochaetes bacterium]|nr:MAG: hypothetical protein DRP54_02640 [Spirochaetota bacterium]
MKIRMRVVGISDVHGHTEKLSTMVDYFSQGDVVLISGDLTNFGHEFQASNVISIVKMKNKNVFAVHGNCDYPDVRFFLEKEGVSLHGRIVEYEGIIFTGIGGSLPCPGRTPNEYAESEIENILNGIAEKIPSGSKVVFVTHEPPYDTMCDLTRAGQHVGSRAVRDFIEKVRPLLVVCGHIHESRAIDEIGETKIVNPGPIIDGVYMLSEIKGVLKSVKLIKGEKVITGEY